MCECNHNINDLHDKIKFAIFSPLPHSLCLPAPRINSNYYKDAGSYSEKIEYLPAILQILQVFFFCSCLLHRHRRRRRMGSMDVVALCAKQMSRSHLKNRRQGSQPAKVKGIFICMKLVNMNTVRSIG